MRRIVLDESRARIKVASHAETRYDSLRTPRPTPFETIEKERDRKMATIYRTLKRAKSAINHPSVVTIGNFDGVHRGHQALLEFARTLAQDAAAVVPLTFDPHPVRYFKPDIPPFELTTIEQRAELLEAHGADAVVVVTFDEEIATLTPEEFVDQILIDALKATHVIVGKGFRFGHKRAGTTEVLINLCSTRGVGVTVHEPILDTEHDSEVISSTRIRELVKAGEVDEIPALLGRPYTMWGEVVHGDARGRELGYPTANITTENEVLPPDGIYTTTLETPSFGPLEAITYVGRRPTYEGEEAQRNIETFVLRWERDEPLDLYEEHVGIRFHDFIRGDRAFDSSEELIEQMDKDVAEARRWHQAAP